VKSNLLKRGFISLIVTQFFGAANDNILKQVIIFMLISGVWANRLGGDGSQGYASLCLTLPFLLLSGYAGQFADKHSKQRVAVMAKCVELPIVLLAGVGLWYGYLSLTLLSLILLAIQSTFFGPAKYGMIPEIVESRDLSRANGTINMLTNIAIILGSMAAGPICDMYFPEFIIAGAHDEVLAWIHGPVCDHYLTKPDPVLWIPGLVMICVAVAGLLAVLVMPRLKVKDPDLRFDWNPFRTYYDSVREMMKGPLIWVALAWAYFYLMGLMAILAIPEYEHILNISFTKTTYLLGVLGVSIGLGSVTAGLISGHQIMPRLIPYGAVGMGSAFLLLGVLPPTYWVVAVLIFVTGFMSGFYVIPLQALIQDLAPEAERGRFMGTTNAMSAAFSSLGAVVYWFAGSVCNMPGNRIFLICAGLAFLGLFFILWRFRISPPVTRGER